MFCRTERVIKRYVKGIIVTSTVYESQNQSTRSGQKSAHFSGKPKTYRTVVEQRPFTVEEFLLAPFSSTTFKGAFALLWQYAILAMIGVFCGFVFGRIFSLSNHPWIIVLIGLLCSGFVLKALFIMSSKVVNPDCYVQYCWGIKRTCATVYSCLMIHFAIIISLYIFTTVVYDLCSIEFPIIPPFQSDADTFTGIGLVLAYSIRLFAVFPTLVILVSVISGDGELLAYNPLRLFQIMVKLFIPILLLSLLTSLFFITNDLWSLYIQSRLEFISEIVRGLRLIIDMIVLVAGALATLWFPAIVFKYVGMICVNFKEKLDVLTS